LITYKKATAIDIVPALNLPLRVFMEYVAPDYEAMATVKISGFYKL
jgi:hypothetical protein